MNAKSAKIKVDGLFTGIAHSILAATKVSIFMSLMYAFISINHQSVLEFLGSFIGMFLMLVLFGGFITVVLSFFVGFPVTIILIKFGLDDELLSAIMGSLIVAFFYLSSGNMHGYVVFLCVYAFFCGGAFMRGYKKCNSL